LNESMVLAIRSVRSFRMSSATLMFPPESGRRAR
jgi:hypothetical protein